MTQTKIDGKTYEVYNKATGEKLKEFNDIRKARGCLKFAVIMGIDFDIVIYENGKDITEKLHEDIARGN